MIVPMPVEKEITLTHRGPVFAVEVIEYTDQAGQRVRRDVVRHPGAVTILPLMDDGRVVLIRNRRIAVDDDLLELPAGKLELADDDPRAAAARELEEETGYRASAISPLTAFFTSPGFADEHMHGFVATGLTPVPQRLEPGEEIEVIPVPMDEALAMVEDGRIRDGKTIATLLFWHTFGRKGARAHGLG